MDAPQAHAVHELYELLQVQLFVAVRVDLLDVTAHLATPRDGQNDADRRSQKSKLRTRLYGDVEPGVRPTLPCLSVQHYHVIHVRRFSPPTSATTFRTQFIFLFTKGFRKAKLVLRARRFPDAFTHRA